jgi:S1-C subfamily serine protease
MTNRLISLTWLKSSGTFFCGLVVLLSFCLGLKASGAVAASPEAQIVKLFITKAEVDRVSPWQLEEVSQQSALGVLIEGGRILTTALAVANGTLLEMQVFGAQQRYELELEFADYEVNLALLKPRNPGDALKGLVPISLGEDLEIDDQVDIYRARDLYQLTKMQGRLQEVGVYTAVTSYYGLVAYLIKIQQTGLGWAEPVMRGGKLVAISSGQDANFAHAIPVDVLRHFVSDSHGPSYRGFPSIGLQLTPLIDSNLRRMLKADGVAHGMRVAAVFPSSPFFEKIMKDDVLVEIDGTPLSEHGYFQHPKWGKVYLKHLITRKFSGESLKLKVLRNGQPVEAEATLPRFVSNDFPVVGYRPDRTEPHLIFGGLLFQELSQDFLKQWGKNWRASAPIDLVYALDNLNFPEKVAGRRIIFLSRVLPDQFNRGYDKLRYNTVTSINDREVFSIEDVREAFQFPLIASGQQFARIKLALEGGEVILSYAKLNAAHQRLAKTNGINSPESFFNPEDATRPVVAPSR